MEKRISEGENMNKMIPETKLTLLAKDAAKKHSLAAILVIAVVIELISFIPQLLILGPLVFLSREDLAGALEMGDTSIIRISPDMVMAVNLFVTVFTTLITILYCTKFEKRSMGSMGFRGKTPFTEYLTGLFLGAGMLLLAWGICLITGTAECTGTSGSISPVILLFFLGFLVQGMSEEVYCRGFIMQSISIRYAPIAAVLVNSLFFAALHLGNNGIAPLAFVNLMLFGIFASLYMWKRGNIWGIAAFHSAWNFAQGNLVGIRVSGSSAGPSVLSTEFMEQGTLINGGSFGIEGGLACTLVYVAGILILLKLPVRKDAGIMREDGRDQVMDVTAELSSKPPVNIEIRAV